MKRLVVALLCVSVVSQAMEPDAIAPEPISMDVEASWHETTVTVEDGASQAVSKNWIERLKAKAGQGNNQHQSSQCSECCRRHCWGEKCVGDAVAYSCLVLTVGVTIGSIVGVCIFCRCCH